MAKDIVINDIICFDLIKTLECGQCFRWNVQEDGSYIGVINDRVIKIKQINNSLYITSNNMDNLEGISRKYFSLDVDYSEVEFKLSKLDKHLKDILPKTTGIRILKQDMWEMLISYIISANNNIPRIRKIIETISKRYGTKVEFEGKIYYLFPKAEQLKNVTNEEYLECGTGFRNRYIYKAVNDFLNGEIDLDYIYGLDNDKSKEHLIKIMGVGNKVADCILLFGMDRQDVFPIDVWIKRVVEDTYIGKDTDIKEILRFANEKFGCLAGIAQQHLFYNARNNRYLK